MGKEMCHIYVVQGAATFGSLTKFSVTHRETIKSGVLDAGHDDLPEDIPMLIEDVGR